MANGVVLQCLFTHQYNTDKPCISESVIGSYTSCDDGGNSSNGKYRSKYFSKSSSLIVGKNKCNKLKRQTKYKNLKYPKQELIYTMSPEQCSESEISLKTSRPYSVSTTYIIDSDVATETSYVIKKSKSFVTTNIEPPFYTEYIIGNVCRKCKSKECKDPYKNPTVRARIYECQLKVAEERRPCSCDSDVHFEVMKGLYECYKNKDCGNCNCILCGHLPFENEDITRNHRRDETFLKGTPNSNQHNIKNALAYTADHGLPLPKGRTKSQKKLVQEVIERRTKKIKALEDLIEKGTGCGTCKVPDCINPLLNPAVRATLLKCQMRSADASCCCACKSGIIYKVMKGMYDCYKSKDGENCKCILCGHLPCEGLVGTSNSEKDFLTVDKIPLSEKPKIVKENLLQCLTLIATKGMHLPRGRTESEKELIDKAEDNAIEDLLKSGEPLTASVKLKIEKRNEIKKHHIGISPEPIDKIEKTKTVPKEAEKSAVALLDGKTLAQKEKITRSLERKGVDLVEVKKTSKKQQTETKESHSETTETENAKIQEKKFAKNKEDVTQSVSSLTDKDKKLKDKIKLKPERSVSDTLILTEKTEIQEDKQQSTKKFEKTRAKKNKKDVSQSANSLTDEVKKLTNKKKLQPERSVSDTLLETKTKKVKAKEMEENTKKKLDKKGEMDSSQKEQVPKLDSFTETKSKKVKAKEVKENIEKKLEKKGSKDLSRFVPDKVLDNDEKEPKEISVPTFEELKNKSPKQKEKILKALANQYLPLPEPRSKSERQLYQRVIKETAPRSFSALEGKTPEEKEKILRNLAINHMPLPKPKTKSEKKLVAKIYREIPTPIFNEFKHKQPEEKEQLLKHYAKQNIQLPKAKTSSEKELVEKIVTEIPPSTMAAIKDRTPSEKEMILKTMAQHNIPLPQPQSASEKKMIDKVLREVPPPPPPPSKIDYKIKSPKEGKKQTAASSYEETKSFTPSKERKIIEKAAKALEKTLKEEEKRSKLEATEIKSKQSQEKLTKDTPPRSFSDLEGKNPKEKEKILKNMAIQKMPLPVPQTKSQKRLIDKINKQIPPPSHHDKDTKSFTPSKEQKIAKEGAKALENTSKEGRKRRKLKSTEGQQSQEKVAKDMIPRTFSDLEGKSPNEKEKILKNMAMQKIPLPVPQTKSQERLIDKIYKHIPPSLHHGKDTESFKPGKRVKSSGTEVNLSPEMEKQNIIRSKAQQHIPLAEPKTSSEKKMIEKLLKGGRKIVCECKGSDMDAAKKLEVAEDLSPKPRGSEVEVLKKSTKTKSGRAAKKPKITDVDAAKKLEVAEDFTPKVRSSEVLIKKSPKTKSGLTAKKPKRKPHKCNQACGCDLREPQFKERVIRIHVTSPDISALCPCPEEPPCLAPHILSGVSVNENNDIVLTVRTAVGAPSYTYKSDGVKCQTSLTKTAHKTLLSPTFTEFYGIRNSSNRIHCTSSRECVSSTVVNSNILNDSLDKLFDVTQFDSIHNVSTFLKNTKSMSSLDILYSNVNYCKYKYPEYSDQSFEQQTGCIQSSTKLDTAFKKKEQLAVFKLFSFRNRLKRKAKNKTNVDILDKLDVNEHWCKDDLPNSDKTLPSSHKTDVNSDKIGKKSDTNEIPEKTKNSTKFPENIDKDSSETVIAVNNYREYPETSPILNNVKIEIESKGNNTDVVKEHSENKQFKDEQNGCGDHIIDNDCYLKERNNNVSSVMLLIPMDAQDQDSEDSLNTCSSLMLLHLSENFSNRYSSRNISVHAVNIDVQASRSRSLARRCDSSWVRSAGTEDAYNCSTPILYSAARGRSKHHKFSVQWSDTSNATNYGMDCGYVRPMHQDYQQSNGIYERSSSRRVRPSPPGFTITRLPKSSREYQREYSDWNNEQWKGNQMYDDRGRLACSGCFSSGRLPQAPPCNKVLEHRDSSPEKKKSKLSKLNAYRGKKWGTKSHTKMQDTSTSTHSYMVFARDEATYCQSTPPTSQIFNGTKGKKSIIQNKCNLFRGKKLWGAKSASKLQDSFTSTHSYMVFGHDQATLCRNIPAITKEDIDTQTIGKQRSKLNKYYNKSATKLSTYYNRSTSKLSNCYAESATKLSKHYKELREKRKSDPKMQDCVTCTHSYAVLGQDQGIQVMDNVERSSSTCVTAGPPYLRIAWKASKDATDMERKHLNIWRGIYKDILNSNINETQSPIYRSEESFHCIKTSTIRQKGDLPSLHRDRDMEPHKFLGYWESSSQSCTVLPPRPKPQSVIVALRCGSNHCQTDSVNQLYQQVCGKKPCHEKPRKEVKSNKDCAFGGAMIIENNCNENRQCTLNANHQDTNLECSVGSVRQLAQRKPDEGAPKKCEPKLNDRGEYVCTTCPGPEKKPPYRPQMNDCGHQRSPKHTRPPNQRMQPSRDPIRDACGCPAEQTRQSTGRRMNCEPKMNACGEYVCTPCPATEKNPPNRPQMNNCGQQSTPEYTRPPKQRIQPCEPREDAAEQTKKSTGRRMNCEPKMNACGEYVCTPCPAEEENPPYRPQMNDCGQQSTPEYTRPPNQRIQPCEPREDAAEQTKKSTGRRMICEPKMNACGEYVCTPCPAAEKKTPYRPQMNDCGQQSTPEYTRPPNQRIQPCEPREDAAEQTKKSTGRRMICEPKMNACGEYVCTPCPAAEKKTPYRPQMNDCGQQSTPEYTRPPNQRIQPCEPREDAAEQTKKSTGRRIICEPKMNIRSDHELTPCKPQTKSCGQQSQQRSPEYTRTPCRRIQADPKMNVRGDRVCTPCPAAEQKPPCKPKTSVCGPQTPPEDTRPPCPGLQPSFDSIRDPCGYPAGQTMQSPCRRIIEPSCFRTPVRNLSGPSLTKCKPKEYFKLSNVIVNPIPVDVCGRPLPRRRRMHGLPECWGPRSPPGSLHRVCGTRITPQCEEQSPWTTGWSRDVPDCSCDANTPRMPCPERTPIGGGLKPPISRLRNKPSRTQEMKIQEVASEVTSGFEMLLGLDVVKHNAQYYERMMKCDGIPVERKMSLKAACSFLLSPFRRSVECSCEEEEKPKENKGFKMKIDAKGSAVLPCNIGSLHLLCLRNKKGSATENEAPSRVKSRKTESPGSPVPVPSIGSEPSIISRISRISRVVSKKSLTKTAPLTSQVEAVAETSQPISSEPSRKSRILSRLMSKNPEESTTETSPSISPEPSRKSRILNRIMSTKPEESTSETTPPISPEPSKKSRILSRIVSKKPEEPATETTPPISAEPSKKSRILSRIMSKKPEEPATETTPPISAEPSKKSRILSRIMSKKPEEPATETAPPISAEPSKKSRILSRIMSKKPEEPATETTPPISAEPSKKSRILSRIMSKKPEEPATETTPPISAEPSKKSRILSRIMSKKPEEPATETTPPISAEPSKKSKTLSKVMSKKPEPAAEATPPISAEPSKKSRILSKIMSKKPPVEPAPPVTPQPSKKSKILSKVMSKKPEETPPETPPPEPSKKSEIPSKVVSKTPEESPPETSPPVPSKTSKVPSKVISKKPDESPPETPPPVPSKKSKIPSKVMSKKSEEPPAEPAPVVPEPSKKFKVPSRVKSKPPVEEPPPPPPPPPPVEEAPPPEPEIVEEVYPYGTTVEEFEVPYGTVIETEETTITTYI